MWDDKDILKWEETHRGTTYHYGLKHADDSGGIHEALYDSNHKLLLERVDKDGNIYGFQKLVSLHNRGLVMGYKREDIQQVIGPG